MNHNTYSNIKLNIDILLIKYYRIILRIILKLFIFLAYEYNCIQHILYLIFFNIKILVCSDNYYDGKYKYYISVNVFDSTM